MRRTSTLLCLSILAAAALASSAAQSQGMLKVSAGTGFVINNEGHLITNAHVVKDCRSISVLAAGSERAATLVGVDRERDLAVLKLADHRGVELARLRANIADLKLGTPVTVLGFPGQAGLDGHYTAKKSSIVALTGPRGEAGWIELASVADHGNSGGPVLDEAGNVIGVVTAMVELFEKGADGKPIGAAVSKVDVAITLATLQDFLHRNAVPFYQFYTGGNYGDARVQEGALKFILPVRCVQG